MSLIGEIRVIYPDTNLLVHLCKNARSVSRFGSHLRENGLVLGISFAQISELSHSAHIVPRLESIFTSAPSYVLKGYDLIRREEVDAYPQRRTGSVLHKPLDTICRAGCLDKMLQHTDIVKAREMMLSRAQSLPGEVVHLRRRFELAEGDHASADRAELFAWFWVVQELGKGHLDFIQRFKDRVSELKAQVILSEFVTGLIIYYRYYFHRAKIRSTDLGDLMQASVYPYCSVLVLEKEMTNQLKHIRKNHEVLREAEIFKFSEFLRVAGL